MIDLYEWLFRAQKEIIFKAERMTGIRAKESFINISDLSGRWGEFSPENGKLQGEAINIITLDKKLFGMGKEFVLMVLSHEILHSLEMVENNISEDHGRDFRMWEMELNKWVPTYFDNMPQIDFNSLNLYRFKTGVSKIITYNCRCGTEIKHDSDLDIQCNKCGNPFYIINDGRIDFEEELRERTKLLNHTANRLKQATDDQIHRYRVLGLDNKLKQICTPKKSNEVVSIYLDNETVKREMELLYKRVLNICALNGARVDNIHLERIAYILLE